LFPYTTLFRGTGAISDHQGTRIAITTQGNAPEANTAARMARTAPTASNSATKTTTKHQKSATHTREEPAMLRKLPQKTSPAWALLLALPLAAHGGEIDGANTAWILTSTALVLFMTLPG